LAEDALEVCHFRCLEAAACGSLDPLAKIADDKDWVCRRCKVIGCNDCIPGTKDECRECKVGYKSDGKGGCWAWTAWVMFGVKIFCLILALIMGAWLVELSTRKKNKLAWFEAWPCLPLAHAHPHAVRHSRGGWCRRH
jgi:hypothetical protein